MAEQLRKDLRQALDEVLSKANNSEASKRGLALLFPKISDELRELWFHGEGNARRDRRLATLDSAPIYFRLDPTHTSWAKAEIEEILNNADPAVGLEVAKRRIESVAERDRGRMRRLFLDELADAFNEQRYLTEAWLRAIVNISPIFIAAADEDPAIFGLNNMQRIGRLVLRALVPLAEEVRANLFLTVSKDAQDLSVLCTVFRTAAGDINRSVESTREPSKIQFGQLEAAIRELLLSRVKNMAFERTIWAQAHPSSEIWFWWGCDLEEEVREFTKSEMDRIDGLRGLMKMCLSLVRSSEGNYEQVAQGYSAVVDLESLKARAQTFGEAGWHPADAELAQRFLAALQRTRRDAFASDDN